MKSFVICIDEIEQSVQSAERCIRSGASRGVLVEKFKAVTPNSGYEKILEEDGIPIDKFVEDSKKYSRYDRVVCAFLSHYSLWKKCSEQRDNFLILEHDAYFENTIATSVIYHNEEIVSIGAPSYGKFNTPNILGIGPLVSKRYFPGAHAYIISPKGAKKAIEKAKTDAGPTDVFFGYHNFENLKEFYPWPVSVKESFSTIQRTPGCLAKHAYKDGIGYGIV